MKIVRTRECRTTAWKNGGGATTEIAAAPAGASLDDFDWRVSMACVASNGPFSEFAGIDRTLAILKGDGLALAIGDAAPMVLDRSSEPIHFPGDTPASARLIAGEIVNLNVMSKRGRFEHRLRRIREPALCEFDGYDIALELILIRLNRILRQRSSWHIRLARRRGRRLRSRFRGSRPSWRRLCAALT